MIGRERNVQRNASDYVPHIDVVFIDDAFIDVVFIDDAFIDVAFNIIRLSHVAYGRGKGSRTVNHSCSKRVYLASVGKIVHPAFEYEATIRKEVLEIHPIKHRMKEYSYMESTKYVLRTSFHPLGRVQVSVQAALHHNWTPKFQFSLSIRSSRPHPTTTSTNFQSSQSDESRRIGSQPASDRDILWE